MQNQFSSERNEFNGKYSTSCLRLGGFRFKKIKPTKPKHLKKKKRTFIDCVLQECVEKNAGKIVPIVSHQSVAFHCTFSTTLLLLFSSSFFCE